jgi:hypothetical protein
MMLFFAAALATGTTWPTYANARFEYSICYPAALKPQREADNSDGRKFVGANGAELVVFGQYALDESLPERAADEAIGYTGKRGKITYRAGKTNWLVVSGTDGASFQFYLKAVKVGNRFVTFQLKYPASQAALFRPIVEKLSHCLVVNKAPL